MTDNEIIKGFEICAKTGTNENTCHGCPYLGKNLCILLKNRDALDLIKRQKAEIESLEKRLKHLLQSDFIRSFDELVTRKGNYKRDIKEADEIIKSQQAEIEKLKTHIEVKNKKIEALYGLMKVNREQGIKEFAERLKKELYIDCDNFNPIVTKEEIDNLVKEMTGKENENA